MAEAMRLADAIDPLTRRNLDNLTCAAAAAELRRLSAVEAQRDVLLEALRKIGRYTGEGSTYSTPWQDIVVHLGQTARAAIALVEGRVKAVEEGK